MPLITIPKDVRAQLARITPERLIALRGAISAPVLADTSQTAGPQADTKRRRFVDRSDQWPEVGNVLEGTFRGQSFRAQIIAAPKLKSRKALKLLTPPVKGTVCSSYSKAQDVVTLAHRQKLGLTGKTGLGPAWAWWKPVASNA